MDTGLKIASKKHISKTIGQWCIATCAAFLILAALWFAYRWYTHGEQPPLLPIPASALADPRLDETPVTQEQTDAHTVPKAHPRYLSIPSLGVEQRRIVKTGLTTHNTLDTPKTIDDIAWYEKSALPAEDSGVVVLNGHNGGVTRSGVFARLSELRGGDAIELERGDGKRLTYRVASNQTMSLQDANTRGMREMMLPIHPNKQGLSIMTCAGNWVPRDKVYDKRIIIRATLEE